MADWFLETGLYLLGVALIPAAGLFLVCRGLWGDRSKGRPRCPKCWYDMRASLPHCQCPECGYAPGESRLYRNRRRWRPVLLGGMLMFSSCPLIVVGPAVGGWFREQAVVQELAKRGHAVRSEPTGPKWLVGRLPRPLGGFFDRVFLATLGPQATDADIDECVNLRRLKILEIQAAGQVTDAGLVSLKELPQLEILILSGTQVTDAGFVHLKGLPQLSRLELSGTQVTGAGLVHLNGLSRLTWLDLSGTQVGDAELLHLKGPPHLYLLILSGTRVTDAGLVHLKELSRIWVLDLSGTQVTDAWLVHLKGLSSLEALMLGNTSVTDAGLVCLKGLAQLSDFDLSQTQVTDAGLAYLKGLSKLERLYLKRTQVTDTGVAELRQALPDLSVER